MSDPLDLISDFPVHVPMGLPFPPEPRGRAPVEDDRPDVEYSL